MSLTDKETAIEEIKAAVDADDTVKLSAILLTRELWALDQGRWDEHVRLMRGIAVAFELWQETINELRDSKESMQAIKDHVERVVLAVFDQVDFKTEMYKNMYEGVNNAGTKQSESRKNGKTNGGDSSGSKV